MMISEADINKITSLTIENEMLKKTVAEQQKEIHALQMRVVNLRETLESICKPLVKKENKNGNSSR